jgi:hypothetical protein
MGKTSGTGSARTPNTTGLLAVDAVPTASQFDDRHMHDNHCRKHSSLNNHTPAMAHGLATKVWSVRKMLETVVS